jgi:hypothetical protein
MRMLAIANALDGMGRAAACPSSFWQEKFMSEAMRAASAPQRARD